MESFRQWCSFVCFGAVGCCVAQLLVPPKGIGRLFHMVTVTAFICCLLLPLLSIGSRLSLDVDFLTDDIVAGELEKKVNEQLCLQVEETVRQLADECFEQRGSSAEKITVKTDISDDGSIHIQQVVLVVDKQNVSVALVVRDVLRQQLGTTVTVESIA